MIGTVYIKCTHNHHEKSNTCLENMYYCIQVPIMIFISGKR